MAAISQITDLHDIKENLLKHFILNHCIINMNCSSNSWKKIPFKMEISVPKIPFKMGLDKKESEKKS